MNGSLVFKATKWHLLSVSLAIAIFLSVFILLYSNYETDKHLKEVREAFLANPQPGTFFVFVFKDDDRMASHPFSIGKIEENKEGKVLLRYSRRSHWEEGLAMEAAKSCLEKTEDCKLPDMLNITLTDLKKMKLSYIFPSVQ